MELVWTVGDVSPHFFTLPFFFSSGLITIALESFEYPWDGRTSIFLLSHLLNVIQVLYNFKQLLKHAIQRSFQRQES